MERKQIVIIQFDQNMLHVCVDILPRPVDEYSHYLHTLCQLLLLSLTEHLMNTV